MSLRPSARTDVRRNRYKVAVDAEEGRRRREDTMVEIRKNRREESLQKKRREGLATQQIPSSLTTTPTSENEVSNSSPSFFFGYEYKWRHFVDFLRFYHLVSSLFVEFLLNCVHLRPMLGVYCGDTVLTQNLKAYAFWFNCFINHLSLMFLFDAGDFFTPTSQ